MRTVAVFHIKGGVGKTTTAVNLAHLAAAEGQRTLLWDLDPQSAATFLFRVRPRVKGGSRALVRDRNRAAEAIKATDFDRLDLLPADFTHRNLDLVLDAGKRRDQRITGILATLADDYDTVVLDCPPSASLVSENIIHAADVLLVPLIPAALSLRTFDQLVAFVGQLSPPHPTVLGFFSMVDRRRSSHRQVVADLPGQRSDICGVSIPSSTVVEQMAVHRAPLAAFAPRHQITADYRRLWTEVVAAGH